MDSALAAGSLHGRSFTLKTPIARGADLRAAALDLSRAESLETTLARGETVRALPCAGTPPWGVPGAASDPTPLAWRDDGTGVLRFFLRLETRSVSRATALADAEVQAQATMRRSLIDLAPKVREGLVLAARRRGLARVEPTTTIVEGTVLGAVLWCGHPRTHDHPELHTALRALFGPLHLRPGIPMGADGGWDAVALSVLSAAAKGEGGHLLDGVHLRSAALQDAHVRVDTKSSALPMSGLLTELLARRPLPRIHRLGFDVLHQGTFREVDVDVDGVVRVVPAPSTAGLWPDRIRRRHADADALVARVAAAMTHARAIV